MAVGKEESEEIPHQFGYWVAVAFTINYIVGTGFLTIPWAFSQAGCFLSVLVLSLVTYLSIAAALFVLETMARADSVCKSKEHGMEMLPLKDHLNGKRFYSNNVGNKRFEVTELCGIFLGPIGRQIYTAALGMYLYCTLLAYATVFSRAFSTHFNIGEQSHTLYLCLYGFLVIPMSCAELSEQIILQVTLAIGRLFLFLVMVFSVSFAFFIDDNPFGGFEEVSHGAFSDVSLNRLHIMLPILVFANIFHHSIPALSAPVADKSQLSSIFTTTIMICYLSYLTLGVLVSLYFGAVTPSSANLLWSAYMTQAPSRFCTIVSAFVVIFPAIDVASCFPLCALTLGNNIMSSFYGEAIHVAEHSRMKRIWFRLIAAVPPVLVAFGFSDLGAITRVSGICGFSIGFLFPSLLAYYSEKRMQQLGLPAATLYSSFLTCHSSIVFTLATSLSLLVTLTIQTVFT